MKYTIEDIGCYFDGAYGYEHNALRLLMLAGSHGFDWTPIDLSTYSWPPPDDVYEAFICSSII